MTTVFDKELFICALRHLLKYTKRGVPLNEALEATIQDIEFVFSCHQDANQAAAQLKWQMERSEIYLKYN